MVSIRSIVERMRNVPFGNITLEAAEKSFFVAKFLCFCHVANNYFCSIAQVYGPSMLPAINLAGDLVLVERISHRIEYVGRGDIVVVRSPENPRKTITKRITGMEGDTVTFAVDPGQEDRRKTIVSINLYSEFGLMYSRILDGQVPKGHVWVQGDNVFASNDSRNFGPVPYALIDSKALIRIWPPSAFGSLKPGV